MRLLHAVAFANKLHWLAQINANTLRTQQHVVKALCKRGVQQRSFMEGRFKPKLIESGIACMSEEWSSFQVTFLAHKKAIFCSQEIRSMTSRFAYKLLLFLFA